MASVASYQRTVSWMQYEQFITIILNSEEAGNKDHISLKRKQNDCRGREYSTITDIFRDSLTSESCQGRSENAKVQRSASNLNWT